MIDYAEMSREDAKAQLLYVRDEGRSEESVRVARAALLKEVDINIICDITGLDADDASESLRKTKDTDLRQRRRDQRPPVFSDAPTTLLTNDGLQSFGEVLPCRGSVECVYATFGELYRYTANLPNFPRAMTVSGQVSMPCCLACYNPTMIELDDIRNGVAAVAPIYNVRSVRLFGSYANGNATGKSDVDLLVEYDQQDKSYLTILGFKEHLASVLGLDVDVLEYPIDEQKLFYKSFRLGEVVKVYG